MGSRRSFIQDPAQLVKEWSSAQLLLQPTLQFDEKASVLYKPALSQAGRVTVISGGGSGHEPAHFGYIGDNLLDAAVAGALFASPNVRQIYRALEVASSPKGTILIVKNYTGDKLNFALALERFKAATGRKVHMVLVGDDVSVPRSRGKFVGRRGLAGTVLVHKIAGAAASRGFGVERIVGWCEQVARRLGTIGASLGPCHVPGQASSGYATDDTGDILLGVGIHNEPPIRTLPSRSSVEEVIQAMLDLLLNADTEEHGFLGPDAAGPGRRLVLHVNNLGGLSTIEMGSLTALTCAILKRLWGVEPCRIFCGTYLSALDGRGFSITLLSLTESEDGPLLLSLLNDHTNATGWVSSGAATPWEYKTQVDEVAGNLQAESSFLRSLDISHDENLLPRIVNAIFSSVSTAEPLITKYDMVLGDGDCGTTLLAGARAMTETLQKEDSIATRGFPLGIKALVDAAIDAMGGTSGAIYGIYLTAFFAALNRLYGKDHCTLSLKLASAAASEALEVLFEFTGARVGDRTLMDALIPFVAQLQKSSDKDGAVALQEAIGRAVEGCESTRDLQARFGRSTYVNEMAGLESVEGEESMRRLPDPGACGVVAVLKGIQQALSS
ncbi:Dak1-domain-containing protein [Aspergillus pseudoustus]|uniref:Dak1-domain-containing protein n=1 Tax=Aspergillus pseudoustus TaxID=1810923 RepID=A0ABR4IU25_9EURO